MEKEDRERLVRIEEGVNAIRGVSEDQEGRIRSLEGYTNKASGVIATMILIKAWVVSHFLGGGH